MLALSTGPGCYRSVAQPTPNRPNTGRPAQQQRLIKRQVFAGQGRAPLKRAATYRGTSGSHRAGVLGPAAGQTCDPLSGTHPKVHGTHHRTFCLTSGRCGLISGPRRRRWRHGVMSSLAVLCITFGELIPACIPVVVGDPQDHRQAKLDAGPGAAQSGARGLKTAL